MCDIHWIHRASNACDTPVDFLEAQQQQRLAWLGNWPGPTSTFWMRETHQGAGCSAPDCSPTRSV
ncbi:hypothetical protein GGI42DRAFT_332730 [Trichoderma sp. SZMC 28013]